VYTWGSVVLVRLSSVFKIIIKNKHFPIFPLATLLVVLPFSSVHSIFPLHLSCWPIKSSVEFRNLSFFFHFFLVLVQMTPFSICIPLQGVGTRKGLLNPPPSFSTAQSACVYSCPECIKTFKALQTSPRVMLERAS
jgi:hypothetical protein